MSQTERFTLVATSLGLFMIFLDALIVNVALPAIQSDFGVGESGLQWVVTAYSLGMAMAMMSGGTAADIYGRRKLYLGGIALFTVASAVCGIASSLEMLNFARAVQGVAAATVNVTSLALVSAAFPDPKLKAWAIGVWTAVASTAIAIGPTLGGFMVQQTGWRSIFMVNLPIGLVVMALTWSFVAESRDGRPRTFDMPGQLLFMLGVGAFAFAVIEGPQAGWLSEEILTLFVIAGAALAAFIFCEFRSADPMMDLMLFSDRTYTLAIITIFAVLFGTYGMLLVITQYLQNVRGFAPTDAGLILFPFSASMMIVSLKAGKLVGVVGSRRLILLGLASQIIGFAVLIAGLQASTVAVGAGLLFVGVGAGLCLTPITSLAMTAVPPERAGMAAGIMSAQRALGSTVGFAVLGSILAAALTATLSAHLASALPDPTERKEVAATIIGNANPRAYAAEIGPGRPIRHIDPATQKAILAAADSDFVEGIRFSLATAMVLLALVLAAGFAWFPRGTGSIAAAEREAQALGSEEIARESPLS
ncbi:MAG TPA: DHA2 family efflux MFS transporter permease subunit [Candidatus Binatia bacterium]